MYKLSKAVRNGIAVTLRGDKFIRCSNPKKVAGVYSSGEQRRTIILETGEKGSSRHPAGVVTFGNIDINIGAIDG